MDTRTAAAWRIEGVRPVAEGVVPPEPNRAEAPARREPNPATSEAERSESTTPVFRDFHYRLDEETGRIVVEVRDGLTGELVRQVPPEELLRVIRGIHRYLGIRVDRRV